MIMRSFREALNQKPQLGFCSMYAAPGIIERIGQDWDWCWIDGQHGEWGLQDTVQAVRACNLAGIFALVRVPGQEQGTIGKMLDTACHAIMVPMVENRAQAEAVVHAARFAPQGQRSYGGRRPIDLYGRGYSHAERPQPLVVCQIESPAAVEQADAIAATAGVDALFFGPDDMAVARGMPMDQARPEGCFDAALTAVASAAKRHGKIAAGVFPTAAAQKQALALGYRLLVCAGDVALLASNSQAAAKVAREAAGDGLPRAAAGPASLY
jgi:4-hydroxy-2-oxoheptanedioate aldolase